MNKEELEIIDFNDEEESVGTARTFQPSQETKKVEEVMKEWEEEEKQNQEKKRPWWRELISWAITLAIAVIAALFLKSYVIINANVPTGSMMNTIQIGDNLFGNRLAYLNSAPERGDIIIFRFPDDESQKYIKRVIGLPGEIVTIDEGKIYINNSETPIQEDYLKEEWVLNNGPYSFLVPEGCYLVLGDNRNNSLDARYWENTYVRDDQIIGKAVLIYYPFTHMKVLN